MIISTIRSLVLCATLIGHAAGAAPPAYPNTGGIGADASADRWYKQCLGVATAAPPAADLAADGPAPAACDAQALYYDAKNRPGASQADWRQVRLCAFARQDQGVLMMLYANGFGVARQPELALKYACGLGGARAEMSGRVDHLLALRSGAEPAPFDLCDDITSGYMQGVCAAIDERRHNKARGVQLDGLTKGWPPQHLDAFERARRALAAFADARGRNETDASGTARAAMAIEAESAETARFARDIAGFERGQLPRYDAARLAAADAQLNLLYRQLMARAVTPEHTITPDTTVTGNDLKLTQRAWLGYRDALAAFGAARYPQVAPASWKTLATLRRVEQLRQLSRE